MSAVGRAFHADGPPPHVLNGWLAWDLAGPDGVEVAEALHARLSEGQLVSFSRWTSVRARFVEDLVETALADGLDQYVILGAGLDSFAYRRPDLLEASVAKLVLERLPLENRPVRTRLRWAHRHPLRPDVAASIPAWQGGRPRTHAIAHATALTGLQLEVRDSLATLVSDLGEPFRTTFEREEAESLVRRMGFDAMAHFSPADAVRDYFGGAGTSRLAARSACSQQPSPPTNKVRGHSATLVQPTDTARFAAKTGVSRRA